MSERTNHLLILARWAKCLNDAGRGPMIVPLTLAIDTADALGEEVVQRIDAATEPAGIPWTMDEVRLVIKSHIMDTHHRWLMQELADALKEAREAVAEARQWFQDTPAHGCPVKLLHKLDAVLAKEYQ